MSERRFTRLKGSSTAAKARETVSRELRQSLSANHEAFLYCIDGNYEQTVREWMQQEAEEDNKTLKAQTDEEEASAKDDHAKDVTDGETEQSPSSSQPKPSPFTIKSDDIMYLNKVKQDRFDFYRYHARDKLKVSSPFTSECLEHYADAEHRLYFSSRSRYFGTVFDTFHTKSAMDVANARWLANGFMHRLADRTFECDEANVRTTSGGHCSPNGELGDFLVASGSGRKNLIREGNASVIDEGEGDFVVGWLTLSRDESREYNCFLTFYSSKQRDRILWHIEVVRSVTKLAANETSTLTRKDNSFKVDKHVIHTDQQYIEDWIKDINTNLANELLPERELARILGGDNEKITSELKSDHIIEEINLAASFADLSHRTGTFARFNDTVHCFGGLHNNNGTGSGLNLYSFLLTIKSLDVQPNERNRANDSYFVRISLFDAKHGKISEEFRYITSPDIRTLRPSKQADGGRPFDQRALSTATRAKFSIDLGRSQPSDLYLVLRLERCSHRLLHFSCLPTTTSEKSSASTTSSTTSLSSLSSLANNNNNNKVAGSSIIRQHVEPYAWSIRPLFAQTDPLELEGAANFGLLYKLDHNRMSDEFIVGVLNQHVQCPTRSQTSLNGRLEVEIVEFQKYLRSLQAGHEVAAPTRPNSSTVKNGMKQHHQLTQSTSSLSAIGLSVVDQDNNNNNNSNNNNNNNSNNNNIASKATTAEIVVLSSSLYPTPTKSSVEMLANGNSHHQSIRPITPILEMQSLRLFSRPYSEYFHLAYIYPLSLKFDSQKVFAKARNLCVTVEVRDSDDPSTARPLPIIFGRPHDESMFVSTATTAVSRHNVTPDFFEEFKVALPLEHSDRLHVLFTFAHVSCKKECTYSVVGYAWLPIGANEANGRPLERGGAGPIHQLNTTLSVFASLPPGYLSCRSLGWGKGLSMPDVKAVGKDLFRVSLVLTSSVLSRDVELQMTLSSIIKITRTNRDDSKDIHQIISLERSLPKLLRQLNSFDGEELVHFAPIILQQLFKLMVFASSQELIIEAFYAVLRLVEQFRAEGNVALVDNFVEQTFLTAEFCGVYVHDQLLILLTRALAAFQPSAPAPNAGSSGTTQQQSTRELEMLFSNLWFILRIVLKSMVQYLFITGRIKTDRETRFNPELVENLNKFIDTASSLLAAYSRLKEATSAVQAIGHFLTRLCSFCDRAIVFNALYHHTSLLSSRDVLVQELKLNTIAILAAHEHYVAYCNPRQMDRDQAMLGLSSEFCRRHFPAFLLLSEFRAAYAHTSMTVRHVRQVALAMLRNQLAKHLLDDRYTESKVRKQVLGLYTPILVAILENTNRLYESTIKEEDGGGGVALGTNRSGHGQHSPSSTLHWDNALGNGTSSTLVSSSSLSLMRSTSEICSSSSTLTSMTSYVSLTSSGVNPSVNTLASAAAASIVNNGSLPSATTTSATGGASSHNRNSSTAASSVANSNKFSQDEIRDLFFCLLSVVQIMDAERLACLRKVQVKNLFVALECSLNCFEYRPKGQQQSSTSYRHRVKTVSTATVTSSGEEVTNVFLQQNLSIQTALITLHTIHLYLDNDREPIDQPVVAQILSIYLTLLSLPQSQSVLIRVFNSLRYFVQKFAMLLFNSDLLSPIIGKVIKYCNSSLTPIRQGATDLLYTLFSKNLKRTRFETIVCVSRLASSDRVNGLLYLHSALNRLELLANVDDGKSHEQLESCKMSSTMECEEEEVSIDHIVERIREILKATKQIREGSFDPYLSSELRLQLANSYARTSRSLMRTWLENLAEVNVAQNAWAEAGMCLAQVIAILIEQLASKQIDIVDGMLNICKVSDNILTKGAIKRESDWLELEECHVSIEVLERIISNCVELLEKAELYELAPHVLKVMVSIYEKEYDHRKLASVYQKLAKMHSKAQEMNDSGKRLFDTFFRVAFYYPGSGTKTEYIYKVAKVVSLAEMTTKLQQLFPHALFVSSDSKVEQQLEMSTKLSTELSSMGSLCCQATDVAATKNGSSNGGSSPANGNNSRCTIVVTHVTPQPDGARNQFEKHVGVRRFVYEQRLDDRIASSVADQYKRRVVLTAAHSLPFLLKRVPIVAKEEVVLSPIEVAIDEMQERVNQLDHVINAGGAKLLQLVLQGSVNATVNVGPIAYANAFLKHPMPEVGQRPEDGGEDEEPKTPTNKEPNDEDCTSSSCSIVEGSEGGGSRFSEAEMSESQKHLKFLFAQFLDLCECALRLNEKLIKANQTEYHNNLKVNFEKLRSELDFCNDHPTSVQIFDVISGATFA